MELIMIQAEMEVLSRAGDPRYRNTVMVPPGPPRTMEPASGASPASEPAVTSAQARARDFGLAGGSSGSPGGSPSSGATHLPFEEGDRVRLLVDQTSVTGKTVLAGTIGEVDAPHRIPGATLVSFP